ncbi:MAG: ABC transporter substrate-binding protein [Acidimicrobiales bacterium]
MTVRWQRAAALVALMVVLVASACTGGGSSGASSGSSSGRSAASRSGGTLRLGLERLKSLDPAAASPGSQPELVVADLLFDGLTTEPADATAAKPALASSWNPSPDLRSWTFTLRSGSTFSNGRVITASDVKYSLERVAKQGQASLGALRLDTITGWSDLVAGATSEIVGIKVPTATTVEIDLDGPLAALPELLSSPIYGVVAKEAVEALSPVFAMAPVGSGPFSYSGTSGDVVSFKRAAGSEAYLDGIEVHMFDDAAKAFEAFGAGKLDWSPVPQAKVDDAIGRYGAGAFRPFQAEVFFAFNLLDPAFADVRLRQAIVKAIDRAAIVKAVYPDIAEPLEGLIPDGVAGHSADACGAVCHYDVDAAKQLVAQAFPDGVVPTVHLDYATAPVADAVAGAIETALVAAGIPVDKRPKVAADYDQFATSGQEGLFQFGWVGLYPDADAYLVSLFTGGSRDNAMGFTQPEVDAQLAAARSSADPAARVEAFQKAESMILSAAPIVPIAQLLTRVVLSPKVNDLKLSIGGTFAANEVWLEP